MPGGTTLSEAAEWSAAALIAIATAALAFAQGGYSQAVIGVATVVVWVAVAAGILLGLWRQSEVPRGALISGACLLGVAVLSATSMAWADDPGRSFAASIRVAGYLGLFTLVVVAVPRTGRRAWILGLAAGLTIVCAAALGSRYAPTLFGDADRELGAAIPNAAGRLSYPIGYWNGLAALLALDVVLLAWLGAYVRGRTGRAVAVGLLPLPVLGFYLASSRGGLAAAAVGGVVLLMLARNLRAMLAGAVLGGAGGGLLVLVARTQGDFVAGIAGSSATHQGELMLLVTLVCLGLVAAGRYRLDAWLGEGGSARRRPVWPWAVLLILAVGAVIALGSRDSGDVNGGGTPTEGVAAGHLTSAGSSGRGEFWVGALDAFASRPIGGVGAGNFELYWNAHPQLALPLVNAHSLYLETLAELGPAGLALLLAFLAVPVVAAVRRRSFGGSVVEDEAALALIAAGALSAALEWTWQIPAAFVPVIAAVGLLAAGTPAESADASRGRAQQSSFALGVGTLVVAWVAIWASAVLFAGDHELSASRSAAARGDLAEAADDARIAGKLQPWSPEPPLQLALVEELGGNLDVARVAALDAIHSAPGDWRGWAVAGRIAAESGNSEASALLLRKAESLSPVALPPDFDRPPRG